MGEVSIRRLGDVAAEQWGLVTLRQVVDAGTPPTTVDRLTAPGSTLQRVASGVFHVAATPIPDWTAYESTAGSIPDRCADGTTGTVFSNTAPNVNLFANNYVAPRSMRSNLQW